MPRNPLLALVLPALLLCGGLVVSAEDSMLAPPAASPPPPEIRTPPAPLKPRIRGPRVTGARPGHPFFYHLPVTGDRPMKFAATGLPSGLTLDPDTGNVNGMVATAGETAVEFTATNAHGSDHATIRLTIGDQIALTPPMGWNSWNHFGGHVTAANVRAAADAMVSSGLIDHGWTYVNIDDCWQGERDAEGNIRGNAKFPDPKALGDYVHAKGLKFGIYSSPGPKTCAGFAGSYEHEEQDARTWASWGADYIKYDWCSYNRVMNGRLRDHYESVVPPDQRNSYRALAKEKDDLEATYPRSPEQSARLKEVGAQIDGLLTAVDKAARVAFEKDEMRLPYRVLGEALAKVDRDIVYSFCQYGMGAVEEWAPGFGGNCWRTTGDISANWKRMSQIGFSQDRLAKYAGPGHWNDPDMLEIGNKGLTPDECYTHMTLWSILAAPLLIGCDMSKMDPFTVSLFSNDEVLAVDQDELGEQGHRVSANGTSEVWEKKLVDGSVAIGLFNRGEMDATIEAPLLPPSGMDSASKEAAVRDLWRQKDLPGAAGSIAMSVAPHGAELLRVRWVAR